MPGFKRKLADALGNALGMNIMPKARTDMWIEERYLKSLLDALRVDCVFDVGANIGQFAEMLRKIGYAGTILSFEPAPQTFATLSEAAAADPRWHVYNSALGESETILPFHVMKGTVFSSFRAPTTAEDTAFSDVNIVEETIDVPVRPLAGLFDELASTHGFKRPFLKMDTQGFDLQVIRGAGDRLQRFLGLSSEMAVRRLYEDSPHMSESISFISECGFDFVGFLAVHPDQILNPLEFNSFAVRRDLARN